jgi:VanZ family protein
MNRFRLWLPAAIWAGTIFFLSSQPPVIPAEQKVALMPLDKWAHLAAFGLLAALVIFALRRAHNLTLPRTAALAIILASAYGAVDEWHQALVPNRYCSLGDWIADATGAALVGLTWFLYESRRRRTTNR